jgi:hypothetical protein
VTLMSATGAGASRCFIPAAFLFDIFFSLESGGNSWGPSS